MLVAAVVGQPKPVVTPPGGFQGVVFQTSFAGTMYSTTVVDLTGRHTPTVFEAAIVTIADGFAAYDGNSSLLLGYFGTDSQMRIDTTPNDDFIWTGDFHNTFYILSEGSDAVERYLFANLSADSAPASANDYTNLSVRYVGSTKQLRLYAGTTLKASSTFDLGATFHHFGLHRESGSLWLEIDGVTIGGVVSFSGTVGGGLVYLGGPTSINNPETMYYDLMEISNV